MQKEKQQDYSIGLNIGTNSVGWAVITDDFKVPSKKVKIYGNTCHEHIKKKLLGSLLFEAGETAAGRRMKRTARRRVIRRQNRLRYLKELFFNQMELVDKNFFHRLEESFLVPEEKTGSRHLVFGNKRLEKQYRKDFPTVYHLRQHLASADEKADLRLIYLALSHIIKFRGHFLINGDLDTNNSDVENLFHQLIATYQDVFGPVKLSDSLEPGVVESLLTSKASKSVRVKRVMEYLPEEKKNSLFGNFLSLALGLQPNFKKVFGLVEDCKLQISKDTYEDDLGLLIAEVQSEYADAEEVFRAAQRLYDAILLFGILKDSKENSATPLSDSMVVRYEHHEEDLAKLKTLIHSKRHEQYVPYFKDDTKDGYAGYINGKTNQEAFYKFTEKLLKDVEGAEYFLDKIAQEDFLKKQRTFDNGVIPHQVHLRELQAIVDNQAKHYPFLADIKDKLEKLLTFRIPYYVGPLARGNSEFAWMVRKNDQAITPWNFDEVVDKEASAEAFIYRMTNNDLYLPAEKVLPKQSFIYEKFSVYNELTRMKYIDETGQDTFFNTFMKQDIFDKLFKEKRKVTKKALLKFLEQEYPEYRIVDVTGFDEEKGEFNASLSSYHDLLPVLGEDFLDARGNSDVIEEIISTLTLFTDVEIIHSRLNKFNDVLTAEQIKSLSRKQYAGWGRLSRKLIAGIKHEASGKTILDYLVDDNGHNRNLMQLIHDKSLDFREIIAKAQAIQDEGETVEQIVKNLAGSPAIKKGILQAIRVVEEIIDSMGYAPKSIAIEMAREVQTTGRGRNNAKPRLKKLEKALGEIGSKLLKQYPVTNQELQNDKLYLFYLQNGKDIYTGLDLDYKNLVHYDVDHVIPRSFIKDDSIDNLVLTAAIENRGKMNDVPNFDVVVNHKAFWNSLKTAGLMTQRKYDNLTKAERGGLTPEDKAGYIKRQLVETRQITKHVARIIDQQLNTQKDENGKPIRNVKVLTLKSSLVTQFRKSFDLYKITEVNDFHHAHDAYLTAVVGDVLLAKYSKLAPEFVYGEYPKYRSFKERVSATKKFLFYSNILNFTTDGLDHYNKEEQLVWSPDKHLKTIKQTVFNAPVNVVKKVEIQSGRFTKETIVKKSESSKIIRQKSHLDPAKYGGFISPTTAYSVLVVAEAPQGKKKELKPIKEFVGITILEQKAYEKDPVAFLEAKGYQNIQLDKLIKLPKYSLFENENGQRRLMVSANELQKANQLRLPEHLMALIYHAKNFDNQDKPEHAEYVQDHVEDIQELVAFILDKAAVWIDKEKPLAKIKELFDKNANAELKDQAKAIVELLKLTSYGSSAGFKLFGVEISRDSLRYASTKECVNSTLIRQSLIGMRENRLDISKFIL